MIPSRIHAHAPLSLLIPLGLFQYRVTYFRQVFSPVLIYVFYVGVWVEQCVYSLVNLTKYAPSDAYQSTPELSSRM